MRASVTSESYHTVSSSQSSHQLQSAWLAEIQTVIDPPLIHLFMALQKRGVIRTDVDLATLVGAFKAMHLGLTVVWAIEGPAGPAMAGAVREQVRLFCSGIEVKR